MPVKDVIARSKRHLLVCVTQGTACGVQYISDGDVWEQPVHRHARIRLRKSIKNEYFHFKVISTYAKVRRCAVGVSFERIQAFEGYHRTAEKAIAVQGVMMLPVVPYLINHLRADTSMRLAPNAIDYICLGDNSRHDAKRKAGLLKIPLAHTLREETGQTERDAPFADHVGACIQFGGAFFGQVPAISLEVGG